MSAIKKFLTDTVIYGFTTIVSRMMNFVLTPFFTKAFSKEVYGVFTNMYAYASMINAILAFGMETTYFRYLHKVESKDRERVFNNSFVVTIFTSALFLATVLIFLDPIVKGLAGNVQEYANYHSYVKLMVFTLVADALAVIPFAKLREQGRPIYYAILKFINIFVFVGTNLFLLFVLPDLVENSSSWAGIASGWFREGWLGNVFISNLLASIVTLLLLIPQILSFRFRLDIQMLKNMFVYSFPVLVANISFIINENLDKMMFPHLMPGEAGKADLGVFGAVTKLAVFLNLFITAFRLGAEPFFFSYAGNENSKVVYSKIMEYFVIGLVVVMVGITTNLDWLKLFLQDESYWEGLFIVPLLLFNYVLLGIYMNLSVWYKLSDQTKYGLYISVIGAIVTIILNFVLIPRYGYAGAAWATTCAYTGMVILSYLWGQKNYPIPYNVQKILVYLVIGAVLSWSAVYVFDYNVWMGNVIWIALLLMIAVSERKNMLSFIAKK